MKPLLNLCPRLRLPAATIPTMTAGDVTADMKSPSLVCRLKGSTGAFLGQIEPSGALLSVDCDGESIAVLSPHGVVSPQNAETEAFIGQMQPGSGCIGVPSHRGNRARPVTAPRPPLQCTDRRLSRTEQVLESQTEQGSQKCD